MKRNIFITTLIAASMSVFISCGDDGSPSSADNCNSFTWTQQVQDEITAFSEAGAAYGQNPTIESCEIFKDAARDYVAALEELNVACITGENEADYREALAEAENSVDSIDCSTSQGK